MIPSSACQRWHADIPSGQARKTSWMSKATPRYGTRSLGVLRLAKSFGRERLDAACSRALEINAHS